MNPFYSYSHNHLPQMSQFANSNSPPPHQSITPIPAHHLSIQTQQNQHLQNQSTSSQQFLQPQSQAASVVAAAAFYARSSVVNNDRRHFQNVTPSTSSQSSSSSSSSSSSAPVIFFLRFINYLLQIINVTKLYAIKN